MESPNLLLKKKAWKAKVSKLVFLIVGVLFVFSVFQMQNLSTIHLYFSNPNHSPGIVDNKPGSTPSQSSSSSSSVKETDDVPSSSSKSVYYSFHIFISSRYSLLPDLKLSDVDTTLATIESRWRIGQGKDRDRECSACDKWWTTTLCTHF